MYQLTQKEEEEKEAYAKGQDFSNLERWLEFGKLLKKYEKK